MSRMSQTAKRSVWIAVVLLLGATGIRADEAAPAAPVAATPAAAAATPKPRVPPAPVVPIIQSTTQSGTVKADLKGVWLLVVNVPLAPGKFKTFPELFKITTGANGPTIELLDVLLPADIADAVKSANRRFEAWQPDAATLNTLRQSWSKLEPAKMKAIDELLYQQINYTVVAPDKYGEVFARRDESTDKVLKAAADNFALMIEEKYQPRDLGPNSRAAQMMGRNAIYGVTSVEKDKIQGDAFTDFIVAGPGFPMPYKMLSPFVMYRLAQ
jgi:hypothetical protein